MDINLWSDAGTVAGAAVATVVVYAIVLLGVRVAGRRTLAQISAFDVLVTIAVGSGIVSAALPPQAAVADGLAVLLTLLLLQVGLAAARQRWSWVGRYIDFLPNVVLRDGAARPQRSITSPQLTTADLHAELRQHGVVATDRVAVMVLEPTGRFSVLTRDEEPAAGPAWRIGDPDSSASPS